jgi:hypothetical protein
MTILYACVHTYTPVQLCNNAWFGLLGGNEPYCTVPPQGNTGLENCVWGQFSGNTPVRNGFHATSYIVSSDLLLTITGTDCYVKPGSCNSVQSSRTLPFISHRKNIFNESFWPEPVSFASFLTMSRFELLRADTDQLHCRLRVRNLIEVR